MKLSRIIFVLLMFIATTSANAQFQAEWRVITNDGPITTQVAQFASVNEARSIIDEIVAVMNLKVNFEVRQANVPNAGAAFFNNKRYILYNPNFIKQINRATGTDWAAISILAHEIGHHVKGHVFKDHGGSSHQNELEADEFSGLVLRRMGATLEEAQIAMRMLAGNRASSTHPAKPDRLEAIAKGWNAGTPATGTDVAVRKSATPATGTTSNTTAVAQSNTAADAAQMARQSATSRESVLPAQRILVDVTFTTDKKNEYFITTQQNVVRWDGQSLVQVGKLGRLKSEDYPFYIYDAQKNYVLISKTGYLVNEKGARVGHLSMHTGAATAGR